MPDNGLDYHIYLLHQPSVLNSIIIHIIIHSVWGLEPGNFGLPSNPNPLEKFFGYHWCRREREKEKHREREAETERGRDRKRMQPIS